MMKYDVIKIPGKQNNGDYIELRRVCTNDIGLPDAVFIREAEEECSNLAIHKRFARRRMVDHVKYEVRRYRAGKLIARGLFKNSPCPEHEVLAYEICKIYGIPCCKADIAKWKNITGCISWYDLRINEQGETIDGYIEGEGLTNKYIIHKEETTGEREERDEKDLSLILDVIDYAVRSHYSKMGVSEAEIIDRIKLIRLRAIEMLIFDRLHGNSDRHNNNWGLKLYGDTQELDFYPLFDNERIYGKINKEEFNVSFEDVMKVIRAYREEAYPAFKRIKDNYKKAMDVIKNVTSQDKSIDSPESNIADKETHVDYE